MPETAEARRTVPLLPLTTDAAERLGYWCCAEGRAVSDLPTVDMQGVELLRAGGPYHAIGSPPEGDYLSVADLARLADDTNAAFLSCVR